MSNPFTPGPDATPGPFPGTSDRAPQFGQQPGFPPTNQPARQQQPHPAAAYQGQPLVPARQKSKVLSLILCFFFGSLGIHNFYLGQTGKGIGHIVLAVLAFVPVLGMLAALVDGIWLLVEFIMIAVGSGSYGRALAGIR